MTDKDVMRRRPTQDEVEAWLDSIPNSRMAIEYRCWYGRFESWTEDHGGSFRISDWIADLAAHDFSEESQMIARDAVQSLSKWVVANTDGSAVRAYLAKQEQEKAQRMRENNERHREWMRVLTALMDEHPDLPVVWIKPADGDGLEWMGGWVFTDCEHPQVSIETIARGWKTHVLIKGESEATRMDDPADPSLEWHDAIVVRMA